MNFDEIINQVTHPEDLTDQFYPEDVQANKISGILASFPALFWVPLIIASNSPYAKFCANQGLILFVFEIIVGIVEGILGRILRVIPLLGGILNWAIGLIFAIATAACFLLLLISACQGKARKLPIIGNMFEAFN